MTVAALTLTFYAPKQPQPPAPRAPEASARISQKGIF